MSVPDLKIHQFTVTRQSRWPDGKLIVEITQGGIDYSNPGALCKKYRGEFETFAGMTAAVEAAIEIAEKWKKDDGKTGKEIRIAHGCTHGMTAQFDDEPANIKTYRALRKHAKEFDEKLPRCSRCNEILDEAWRNPNSEWTDETFCSEYCADKAYEADELERLRLDEEELKAQQEDTD